MLIYVLPNILSIYKYSVHRFIDILKELILLCRVIPLSWRASKFHAKSPSIWHAEFAWEVMQFEDGISKSTNQGPGVIVRFQPKVNNWH